MTRRILAAALTLAAFTSAACADTQGPLPSQTLAADLTATKQVLAMTLTQQGTGVTGSANLTSLTGLNPEALTVAGTRIGDTVTVTYARAQQGPLTFHGYFISSGTVLSGVLDGDEFTQVAVLFKYQ